MEILFADAQPIQNSGGGLAAFLPFILIMFIIYFLMIRPQNKRMKERLQIALQDKDLGKGNMVVSGNHLKVEFGLVLQSMKIVFENVLLCVDGDDVKIGQPFLKNAQVTAEVLDEIQGSKISILRFRRRKHSMRKIGHRQRFTKIIIKDIKVGK